MDDNLAEVNELVSVLLTAFLARSKSESVATPREHCEFLADAAWAAGWRKTAPE